MGGIVTINKENTKSITNNYFKMRDIAFITLHHSKTEHEWFVNVANIAAIRKNVNGEVNIYLIGDSVPIRVDETIEEITELFQHLNQ